MQNSKTVNNPGIAAIEAHQGKPAKKKLLIVTTVPDTLELILESQPRFLNDFYHVIVVSSERQRVEAFAVREGVDCDVVMMNRGISPLADALSICQMFRILRRHQPDIVHSYTPKAAMISAIAGFFARVPLRIHTFTGLIFPHCTGLKKHILKFIDRLVCRLNTHIVPEGEGVRQVLCSISGKPLKVIGYGNIAGVDLTHFHAEQPALEAASVQLRQQLGFTGKRVFCFVGRLNKDKGIQELCQAFLSLDQEKNALLIVGGLDDENPVDDDTMQRLKRAASVSLMGFQSDVRIALMAADVFVLPSYREGFPNVVLQAGAMAKPLLVTDVHGSNEIVEHGLNGWVVPAKDAQALCAQMQVISQLNDAELCEKGANALRLVRERFDRYYYQRQLLAFYQGILK